MREAHIGDEIISSGGLDNNIAHFGREIVDCFVGGGVVRVCNVKVPILLAYEEHNYMLNTYICPSRSRRLYAVAVLGTAFIA